MELLQELRVAIPGVQVLFAFLLTIPFSQGFTKLDFTGKVIYSLTLVLAALATGSLIAPTSYHRIAFREGEKKRMLFTSNRLAIVGLGLLAAAISTSVVVVMIAVFDMKVGAYMGGGIALVLFGLWYGMPLLRKESRPDS
jgi:hypothetical protein